MEKPLIAIPLGDPAGIGPEIVIKTVAETDAARCLIIGSKKVVENAMTFPGMPILEIAVISKPKDYQHGKLNIIDMDNVDMTNLQIGKVSGMCGRAAYEYIVKSIELTMTGKCAAVTTPPVNKEAFRAGNVPFIGHTEIFGELTGTEDPLTLFEVNGLRVFFLSRHMSLRQACDYITKEKIVKHVHRCVKALRALGVTEGTMAVAGLNPHSGEHGLFGDEEVLHIAPAVEQLKKEGLAVEGPIGADSVFHLALTGRYNSVLSLYHDQGHIATKTLDFERTISITAGMPILRTSVDHGTAFDIAGTGKASSVSLVEAVRLAAKYSRNQYI